MKTNTYAQFKEWVKTTCINKSTDGCRIYNGDTAHAIYTAWYMFKHQLSEQEVDEYIHQDVIKTAKHFKAHGFRVSLDNDAVRHIEDENRILIPIRTNGWNRYCKTESGGYYFSSGSVEKCWKNVVKSIWEYWSLKLIEEQEGVEDGK